LFANNAKYVKRKLRIQWQHDSHEAALNRDCSGSKLRATAELYCTPCGAVRYRQSGPAAYRP